MPNISIIIPAYNVYQYLSDCLDSIFSQDIDNCCYEVIVVDDCSPYNEKAIVDTYINKYSNIKYIRHNINKRQGGARNTGLRIADGEYVMFIDADDFIVYKNTFSVLLNFVKKYNPVVLRSEVYKPFRHDTSYRQLEENLKSTKEFKHSTSNFKEWRLGKFSCSVCSTLYKRTFLLENNLFFRENVLFEDTDWVQKTMYYAEKIDFIDFSFYGYRQSINSTTRGHSIAAFEGNVESIIETYRFFQKTKLDDTIRELLDEGFTKSILGALKTSRNYSTQQSYKILNKLNLCGLTSIQCNSKTRRCILFLMRHLPILPITIVKILVSIKRLFQ